MCDQTIRPDREYRVEMHCEDGGNHKQRVTIPSGTEEAQDEAAMSWARAETEDWIRDAEWGDDGATVCGSYVLRDAESTWEEEHIEVEIAPKHQRQIRSAMGDRGCGTDPDDHTWTGEGHGGCSENPGVWSTGGTGISISEHCEVCGLVRHTHLRGSNRNPGESDTVSYRAPTDEELVAWGIADADADA
jgi:hypothetical protein